MVNWHEETISSIVSKDKAVLELPFINHIDIIIRKPFIWHAKYMAGSISKHIAIYYKILVPFFNNSAVDAANSSKILNFIEYKYVLTL